MCTQQIQAFQARSGAAVHLYRIRIFARPLLCSRSSPRPSPARASPLHEAPVQPLHWFPLASVPLVSHAAFPLADTHLPVPVPCRLSDPLNCGTCEPYPMRPILRHPMLNAPVPCSRSSPSRHSHVLRNQGLRPRIPLQLFLTSRFLWRRLRIRSARTRYRRSVHTISRVHASFPLPPFLSACFPLAAFPLLNLLPSSPSQPLVSSRLQASPILRSPSQPAHPTAFTS